MPKMKAQLLFDKCIPEECSDRDGTCASAKACKKSCLEQEDLFESPVIFSLDMCVGCGDCVDVCPFKAVKMV